MMGYTVSAVQISSNRRTAFLLAQALSCCLLRNRKLPYCLVAANPSKGMPGKNMLISSLVKQCFQASPSKLAYEHRPKLLRRSSDLFPFTHRC
jgi:hypothetical protein